MSFQSLNAHDLRIPSFIKDEYPIFVEMIEHYYDWLTIDGNAGAIAKIQEIRDIDTTPDNIINNFLDQFFYGFDRRITPKIDKRVIIEHAIEFFKSKGTEDSLKYLFKIAYGDDVEIFYPKDQMMEASESQWSQNKIIKVALTGVNDPFADNVIGRRCVSENTNLPFTVSSLSKFSNDSVNWYATLFISQPDGSFENRENIILNYEDEFGFVTTYVRQMTDMVVSAEIIDSGNYYIPNEPIQLSSLGSGTGVSAKVSSVSRGKIEQIKILDGGSGYTVDQEISVDNVTDYGLSQGSGAQLVIKEVQNNSIGEYTIVSSGQHYRTDDEFTLSYLGTGAKLSTRIRNGVIETVSVIDGGYGYKTPVVNFSNVGSGSGVNTTVVTGYDIKTVKILDSGFGYTSIPNVSITLGGGSSATATAHISAFLQSITIDTAGTGYVTAPTITIDAPPSGGTQATAHAVVSSGNIVAINIINSGSGYTSIPNITIGGPGSGAHATAVINATISAITIDNYGTGYTSQPTISIAASPASGGNASAEILGLYGVIKSVTVNSGGSNYSNRTQSAIVDTFDITTKGKDAVGTIKRCISVPTGNIDLIDLNDSGTGYLVNDILNIVPVPEKVKSLEATVSGITKVLGDINVINPGSGFTTVPTVTIDAPSSGRQAKAYAVTGAVDKISKVTVDTPGSGYTSAPNVSISGTGTGASLKANISAAITSIDLKCAGWDYASTPSVVIEAPVSGTQATAHPVMTGRLKSITLQAEGKYSQVPSVSIAAPTGSNPITATATANVDGYIDTLTISNAGSGYNTAPTITIGAGTNSTALATCTIAGPIATPTIDDSGSGYTTIPKIYVTPPTSAVGNTATATSIVSGALDSITIISSGDYTVAPTGVSITGGGGSGAHAVITASAIYGYGVNRYRITSIAVDVPGSGYTSAPTITFTGGTGVAAVAVATVKGTVSSITPTGGTNYSNSNPPKVSISSPTDSTGTTATATATVSGNVVTAVTPSGGTKYTHSKKYAPVKLGSNQIIFTRPIWYGSSSSVIDVDVGSAVTGTGIPANTKVTNVSGNVITISNNATVTNNWVELSFVSSPSVTIEAPGTAQLTAVLTAGSAINRVFLDTKGIYYNSLPTISSINGGGSNAAITVDASGSIVAIAVTNGGSGYIYGANIVITSVNGQGSGARARANIQNGIIHSIDVIDGGSGYTVAPNITIEGNSAKQSYIQSYRTIRRGRSWIQDPIYATKTVWSGTSATAVSVIRTTVSSLTITNGGTGYSSPSITWNAPATQQATATVIKDSYNRITEIRLVNPGIGYVSASATLTVVGYNARQLPSIRPRIVQGILVGFDLAYPFNVGTATPVLTISAPNMNFGSNVPTTRAFSNNKSIASITVNYAGTGYTVPPTITIDSPTPGVGSVSAKISAKVNGSITGYTLVNKGSGYLHTALPTITITGTGTSAVLTPTVRYKLTSISVNNRGNGYLVNPAVTISNTYEILAGSAVSTKLNLIESIAVDVSGSGYTAAPKVYINGGNPATYATAKSNISGYVESISIISPGSGYTGTPTISFSGGGGSDAHAVVNSSQYVQRIVITDEGYGYLTPPSVTIGGPGTGVVVETKLKQIGNITSLSLVNNGSGLKVNDILDVVKGTDYGVGAAGVVSEVSGTSVAAITLQNQGVKYRYGDILELSPAEEPGRDLTFEVATVSSGTITKLNLVNSGSGYRSGDIVQLNEVNSESTPSKFQVTNTSPLTLSLIKSGMGYRKNNTLKLSSKNSGFDGTIKITQVDDDNEIVNWTIENAGSDYKVGDLVEVQNDLKKSRAVFNVEAVSSTGSIIALSLKECQGYFVIDELFYLYPINSAGSGSGLVINVNTVNGTGGITAVTIRDGGKGYNKGSRVSLNYFRGSGVLFSIGNVDINGKVTAISIISAGSNYSTGYFSTRNVSGGKGGVITVTSTNSFIVNSTLTNRGSGYTAGSLQNINSATGSGAQLRITRTRNGFTSAASIAAGGSGYKVGDVLVAFNNEASHNSYFIFKVTKVSNTNITGIQIIDGGDSYSAATVYETWNISSDGLGAFIKVDSVLNGSIYEYQIVERGVGYNVDDLITIPGGTSGQIKVTEINSTGNIVSFTLDSTNAAGYIIGDIIDASHIITGSGAKVKVLGVDSYGSVGNVSLTADTTLNSNVLTDIDTSKVHIGMLVAQSDGLTDKIPANTYVEGINYSNNDTLVVTLSNKALATINNLALVFYGYEISSAGTNYVQYQYLKSANENYGSGSRIRVTGVNAAGAITNFEYMYDYPGSGYGVNDNVILSSVNEGYGAKIKVNSVSENGSLLTYSIINPGVNYSDGDVVDFMLAPRGDSSQIRVDSIRNGNIKSVEVTNPGIGYDIQPTLVPQGSGTGARFAALGKDIGKLKSIEISSPGFGYITVPTIDLSILGDGKATAVFKNGPLFNESGAFKSEKGKLSGKSYLTDGEFYQKYSYVIKTSKSYKDFESLVKKMVHPAGFKMFGQLLISNGTGAIQAGLGAVNLNAENIRGSVVNFNLITGTGYSVGDIVYFYNNYTIHNDSFFSILVDTVSLTGEILTYTVSNRGSGYTAGRFYGHGGTGTGAYIEDISFNAQGSLYTSVSSAIEQSNYSSQKYISAPTTSSVNDLQNVETTILSDTSFTNRSFQVLTLGTVTGVFGIGEIITEPVSGQTAEVIGYNIVEKRLVVSPLTAKIPSGSVTINSSGGATATNLTENFYTFVPGNTQADFELIANTVTGISNFISNETVEDWTFSSLININSYTKRTNFVADSIVFVDGTTYLVDTNSSNTVYLSNTAGLKIGMTVTGENVPANTTITFVGEDYLTLSNAVTITQNYKQITISN